MFKFGEYKIHIINDLLGVKRDPSTVYPNVKKSDWHAYKDFAQNKDGTIQSTWRGYLLQSPKNNILIDTGMGPGPYDHTEKKGMFLQNLKKVGVSPDEINYVFITHTHGDHIGNNIKWRNNKPLLNFPNAKYLVSKFDFDHYLDNQNNEFIEQVLPLKELSVLSLISGKFFIEDNIWSLPTNGHTPGHQCLFVNIDDNMKLVFTGDLFHNEAQITENLWCPIFDWDTNMSTISRAGLFNLAFNNDWIICTGHLEDKKAIGKIISREGILLWDPIQQ